MQDFINSTVIWMDTEAVSVPDEKNCQLILRIKNDSLLISYLQIIDPEQHQCLIPIRNEMTLTLSNNILIFSFHLYSSVIAFSFTNMRDMELIASHCTKSILFCQATPDLFPKENRTFLAQFSSPNIPNGIRLSGERTSLLPITSRATSTKVWHKSVKHQNTQFYIDQIPLRFSFLTWNVASRKASNEVLSDLIKVFHVPAALNDLIFIAFEEIDMSMKSVVTGSTNATGKWYDSLISAQAQESDRYELLAYGSLGGVFGAILVRKSIKARIPIKVHPISTIKLGAAGMLCNKGALLIPLTIAEMNMMAIFAHLAPHDPNWDQRDEQFHEIIQRVSEIEAQTSIHFDYVSLMGDLNYRISDTTYADTLKAINEHRTAELFEKDQLRISMQRDKDRIGQFHEPLIKFNPSYKDDKRSDVYDTSSKKRI